MRLETALVIFFLAVFTSPASAKSVNFTDCGSAVGKLVSIDISPCDQDPCVLKIGSTVTGTITFIPHERVVSGTVHAYAFLGDYKMPLHLPYTDPCENYGMTCPLPNGKQQEMVVEQYIEEGFPAIKLTFMADVTDQNDKMVFCGQLDLQISY